MQGIPLYVSLFLVSFTLIVCYLIIRIGHIYNVTFNMTTEASQIIVMLVEEGKNWRELEQVMYESAASALQKRVILNPFAWGKRKIMPELYAYINDETLFL